MEMRTGRLPGARGLKQALLGAVSRPPVRWIFKPWTLGHAPVFMLHRFCADENLAGRTSARLLEQALSFVRKHDYRPLTLTELCRLLSHGELPPRSIVFTVDDGYSDFGEVGFPLFRRFGVPVTVFLASGFVDGSMFFWWDRLDYLFRHTRRSSLHLVWADRPPVTLRWDNPREKKTVAGTVTELCKAVPEETKANILTSLRGQLDVDLPEIPPAEYRGLSWDNVRELSDQGVDFGAHSVTHPILSRVTLSQQRFEILESIDAIERRTGKRPATFAYPNGRPQDFGPETVSILVEAGVAGAVTSSHGVVSAKSVVGDGGAFYRLPRLPMPDRLERFIAALSGFDAARQRDAV